MHLQATTHARYRLTSAIDGKTTTTTTNDGARIEPPTLMMGSSTGDGNSNSNSELASPKAAAAAATASVTCEGVEFTVTERNEVAEVVARDGGGGGAVVARVLGSESFVDASTGTRHHFVDVQGRAEAMLFLVSVREDQRRIVAVSRCC